MSAPAVARARPLEPPREVLSGVEARAIAVAGGRYAGGSAAYEGCRAGFLDGYLPGKPCRRVAHPTPGWLEGYRFGFEVGMSAEARDLQELRP